MSLEHFPSLDTESTIVSQEVAKEIGHLVVFRVMNLDEHPGVIERKDDDTVTYRVDNQQYPDQGDFAFGGQSGLDDAITRAYPHGLSRVHAVRVPKHEVVTPYPDEAPDLVYIANGAVAEAKRVPGEMIDAHIAKSNTEKDDPKTTQEAITALFPDHRQ